MEPLKKLRMLTGIISSGGPNGPAEIGIVQKLINEISSALKTDHTAVITALKLELAELTSTAKDLTAENAELLIRIEALEERNKFLTDDYHQVKGQLVVERGKVTRLNKKLESSDA